MISRSDEGRRQGGRLTKVQLRPEPLTRGLGWVSIALGMAELLAPRTVARAVGTDSAGIVRLYGLRELACGIGILAFRDPTPFLWARVGGDVIDLATLAATSNKTGPRNQSRATRAAVNVMAITALDLFARATCEPLTHCSLTHVPAKGRNREALTLFQGMVIRHREISSVAELER